MTRLRRILRLAAIAVAGLLMAVIVATVIVVQTQWFRDKVRAKIVSAVESATGGTAEIGTFAFDWRHLRAQIRDFTIHGLEQRLRQPIPAPLFHANLVQVDLKLLSPFRGFVDIAYLLLDTPEANVIVFPDGQTNIPAPRIQAKSSDKTGLETIVDLAIGRFDLRNGSFTFGDRTTGLDASGANFRTQLGYNAIHPAYSGEIDIRPLHVRTSGNTTIDVDITLPVTAWKDKIELSNAQFTTSASHIVLSAAMDHLVAPRTSGHLTAQVSLDEVRRAAGLNSALDLAHGPRVLMADITASMDQRTIQIRSARVSLGRTNFEASGNLKEDSAAGARFNATLDLGELGGLLRVAARPTGLLRLGGTALLDAKNDYHLAGNVEARQVAFRQGTMRISNVSLDSSVTADPHRIALSNLRLDALGGRFVGAASLQEMRAFELDGRLQNFDLEAMAHTFMQSKLGYNGIVSGSLHANGNVKNIAGLSARANLAVVPAASGNAHSNTTDLPVSGRLDADYNGRADTVTLRASYLALPHTHADFSGQLGRQIQVKLVSTSFADFLPLGGIPATMGPGGSATLNATVSGTLSAPDIAGTIAVNNFSVEGRPFTRFSAGVTASPSSVALGNAVAARGVLQLQLSASLGLSNWKPLPASAVRADAAIRNADVRDILALAGDSSVAVTGAFTADAHINGTFGSPTGTVDISAANGSIEGEKFDAFTLQAIMAERSITVPALSLIAGVSRIDANGVFQHPPNDLQQGSISGNISSNQVQLAQFQSLVKDRPGFRGLLSLKADVSANLRAGQFEIATLNANLAARGLAMEGKSLGDLTATANTTPNTAETALRYDITSDFAGSTTHISGQTELRGDYRTTATASISNLPVDRALAIAGRRELPFTGTLAVTAQVSGTLQKPQANASVTIANGSAYREPFTRLQADCNYTNASIDVPRFHLEDGPSFLDASLSFTHPANDLEDGDVRFHVNSNQVQLASVRAIKQSQPALSGIVQLTADGAARLRKNAMPLFSTLSANLHATGISLNRQNLGDLTAEATTRGNAIEFNLTSDLAHSNFKGAGTVQLTAGYPVSARLTFSNVTYRGLSPLLTALSTSSPSPPLPLDASLGGQLSISGPAGDTAQLRGTLELTTLEAHSAARAGLGPPPRINLALKNSGKIVASLDRGMVTIGSFRLAGQDANLTVSGTASLEGPGALHLRIGGNVSLELLEAFDSSIYSSGAVTLNAAINGTAENPDISGQLQLQKASFNNVNLPNGISNANGTVAFTGREAYIRNITGESGGGKVTLSGMVGYGGPLMQFHLQAAVAGVHIQYPATITTQVGANLAWNGTSARSVVTGTVNILEVSLHAGADIGNVLTAAAAPPSAPTGSGGVLAGMRFDVRIMTAPDTQFQTTLTQNLQADAKLTLLGTPDNPGMIGRVAITGGNVVFFGSKYAIDQGTISFSDPSSINPILNIALETTVQGIGVTLSVSGPMARMNLSYRSDPPLQFQQIVSLLASGTTPDTDPVLAAHSPVAPQQSTQQSGASALLGQAVANPFSGRLQRLFGVTQMSISPQIVGTANTAQATLTLQQQVTRAITFTYIEDVTDSNPQVIRAEWAINPHYSAVAERDVNGEISVNFFYKKRFH
jgi:translocation and assembly module TamB